MKSKLPAFRRNQIHMVQELISECAMLDYSTGTIDRMRRIQKMAMKLRKMNLLKKQSNFMTWLLDIAYGDDE